MTVSGSILRVADSALGSRVPRNSNAGHYPRSGPITHNPKAYVHSLGEALHYEFRPLGVYVTVLAAGFTNTAVLETFGLNPKTMPMKPMSVEQCLSEGLSGLLNNRSRLVPGRLNRILNALRARFSCAEDGGGPALQRACQQVHSCKRTGGRLISKP
jgi:hypothetical protein